MKNDVLQAINEKHGDIPVQFMLGWVKVESAGNIHSTTSLDERGLFQLMPSESKSLGIDHQRLGTDVNYSVEAGVKLIQHYEKAVEKLGFLPDDDAYWHMVKFEHAMGSHGVEVFIKDMKEHGADTSSWDAIQDYAVANEHRLLHEIHHSPSKWIENVNHVFQEGQTEFDHHTDIFDPDGSSGNIVLPASDPHAPNISNPDGTVSHYGPDSTQPVTDQQNASGEPNFSNPDGTVSYYVSDSTQQPYSGHDGDGGQTVAITENTVTQYGPDSTQQTTDLHTQGNDPNTSNPDGTIAHNGVDVIQQTPVTFTETNNSNDTNAGTATHFGPDSTQQAPDHNSGNDPNTSNPDGTVTHNGPDSSQQTTDQHQGSGGQTEHQHPGQDTHQQTDHSSQVNDDGSQSLPG